MDVVAHTTDTDNRATCGVYQLTNVAVNTVQMFVGNLGTGGFNVENYMQIDFAE